MAKDRLQQFTDLRLSFVGFGIGGFQDLAKTSYETGAKKIIAALKGGDNSARLETDGSIDSKRFNLPIRVGHIPKNASGIANDLSGMCPFSISVNFDGDSLKEVKLTLFLLNPRFLMAKQAFIPASVGTDNLFTALSKDPAPCGLVILSDPDVNSTTRYQKLIKELPASTFDQATGFEKYDEKTLTGRFDLTLSWNFDDLAKAEKDIFGRVIGTPNGFTPTGITALRLFSPSQSSTFNGLLSSAGGFGIHIPRSNDPGGKGVGLSFILKTPTDPGPSGSAEDKKSWQAYRAAVTEFDLTRDFKGFLFEGAQIHWLSDNNLGHKSNTNIGIGISAVSFGSGHAVGTNAEW